MTLAPRIAMFSALLSAAGKHGAADIVRNVIDAVEHEDPADVYDTLETSPTLAKHVPAEKRAEAAALAGNAWRRARGLQPLRHIEAQRLALATATGSTPREAAEALGEEVAG